MIDKSRYLTAAIALSLIAASGCALEQGDQETVSSVSQASTADDPDVRPIVKLSDATIRWRAGAEPTAQAHDVKVAATLDMPDFDAQGVPVFGVYISDPLDASKGIYRRILSMECNGSNHCRASYHDGEARLHAHLVRGSTNTQWRFVLHAHRDALMATPPSQGQDLRVTIFQLGKEVHSACARFERPSSHRLVLNKVSPEVLAALQIIEFGYASAGPKQ
jgi:hypothetical protein